ncbi:MAG: biopolymer transporter ExbD [Hydrogenothermaceae bacterium]|nr:biopolymer transporter ExbD [Hydrogenothermaceae bacterium]
MRRFKSAMQRSDEPNITPLIDVVFILLIFFIVSATFIKEAKIEIERPQASTAQRITAKEIRVYIDKAGNIYIDDQLVKLWTLQSKVRDLLSSSTNKTVLVIVDKDARVEVLVDVVDQIRLAGAKDVAVSTKQELG